MKVKALVAACGMMVALVATAQSAKSPIPAFDPVDPGLWETRVKTEGMAGMMAGPQMQELRRQMESMPPEQRRQMQAILEQQAAAMAGTTDRYCVTPEEAAQGPASLGADEEDEDCETVYGKRQGKRMPFTLRCKEPPSEGKGELVFESRRAMSMDMRMTIREPGEPPREMRMQSTHRWIAADCGDVKP
ncbi:MAG: DUF3617 domain-containing protein [Burkholderiales bacterium]|nr:MAG: DUF3617 domain-containing protein [Burkholderiales bacterium]